MAFANPMFRDSGSNNKPPLFCGEYFDFWKIHMKAHLEAQGDDIQDVVQNGQFVLTSVANDVETTNIKSSWNEDDKKNVLYNKKAINILQGAFSMDEFFCVSQCRTIKKIWDTLLETHERTAEVKRSRLNMLSQEYELFIMHPRESIMALQKKFAHLTNHLIALGKTFTNDELNLKVIRSLTKEWKQKVMTISEKKSLSTMTSASLFGKLQEHEMELERLEKHEIQVKGLKDYILKTIVKFHDSNKEDEFTYEDDDLIRKFEKLLRKERKKDIIQKEVPTTKVTYFECGKRGHATSECPTLEKKDKFKRKNHKREKRAYVT